MMRPMRILAALAGIVRLLSFTMLLPILAALRFEDYDTSFLGLVAVPESVLVFLASFAVTTLVWIPLHVLASRAGDEDMLDREAFLTVAAAWLVVALFGMLPFLISGLLSSPLDAFFEAMSGFTGTGSSVIAVPLESVAPSYLFWRSLLQFLGGMGIIVLFVAFLSTLAHGGLQLFQAEAASHVSRRLKPKLVQTARTLWVLYMSVSSVMAAVLTAVILWRTELPWDLALFEGINHTMTAYATGGFSTHTVSAAWFDDVWIEGTLILFMLMGGVSFTALYHFLRQGDRRILREGEFRFYVAVAASAVAVNVAFLWWHGRRVAMGPSGALPETAYGPLTALRDGAFATVSLYTGTGLSTADYSKWPQASILVLLVLMLMGGMAGSTAAAIKSFRWLILFKMLARELRKIVHPRAVIPVRLGTRVLKEEIVAAVAAFFFTYLALWTLGTLALATLEPGMDALPAAFATASSLGNVGGGISPVGPQEGYAALMPASKAILALLMWAGRMEIFAVLLLFYPSSWKN